MITYIYNLSKPEQGGVGRYVYELLKRADNDLAIKKIDTYAYFGNTYLEKLIFILLKKKMILNNNIDRFSKINHFLQVELFYNLIGKNIVTFHNPPPFSTHNDFLDIYRDFYSMSASILFYRRYMAAIKKADFIIANSSFTKEGILQHTDSANVKIIPFGVDDHFRIIRPFSERNNLLGYIGSFATHKRVDRLLCDFEKTKEMKKNKLQLWGGKGIHYASLKSKYHGRNNILFKGFLTKQDEVNVYNNFKAFLFPSKWESFGLPILEAVACGTPVFIYGDARIPPEVKKYALSIDSLSEISNILETIDNHYLMNQSIKVKKEFNWDNHFFHTRQIYDMLQQT